MRKTCSTRLFVAGILAAAALFGCLGFFAGTQKTWHTYEKRIQLLSQEKEELQKENVKLAAQKPKETVRESSAPAEPYAYLLLEEEGYVSVYHTDRKTKYADTGIRVESLPTALQKEIRQGKYMESEVMLYNFLENYSS